MKVFTLLSILVISPQLQAMSCDPKQDKDLSAPGQSLADIRTTNQNGLGICHIEQLHKMVRARLPGHPDLSRVQMAMMEKKVRDENAATKKAVRWKNANGTVGGVYFDAGNSCEAFNRIKNQKICKFEDDRFEQLTKVSPENQMKIMGIVSSYFDDRAPVPNSWIETRLNTAFKQCGLEDQTFASLKKSYQKYLLNIGDHAGAAQADSLDKTKVILNVTDHLTGTNYDQLMARTFPLKEKQSSSAVIFMKNRDAAIKELQGKEACSLQKFVSSGTATCSASLHKSEQDIANLTSLGLSMKEIVKILDGKRDRDRFFAEAFACNGEKTLIPGDINCKTVELNDISDDADSVAEYVNKVDAMIQKNIQKGTPVGISTCTRFFSNKNARTMKVGTDDFNCGDKTAPGYSKGEGSHAVTIIGSRCKNGQKEYLIQNSWGPGCFYDASFECTKKGGFWAPTDVVTQNIRNINFLD